ncbi:MAG: branched-chain amino acid transport system II carrier protein [Peptostreptococcaceae bacterium]
MKKNMDTLIIGFALFSMFFGAGNLIFPPYIGVTSGSSWLVSFLGFVIADIGIILLSIYAIAKAGSYQNVVGRAGKRFGISLEFIMMLCLGPILVVPRTGATTYEMSIAPIFNNFNPVLFSIIFFGLTFVLTIKPTKVMDIIGKFLTPVLLVALAVLIIRGIITPVGDLTSVNSDALFFTGLTQGYQTMDALGLGGIVALIMTSFLSKGYNNKKEVQSLTIKAALIAGCGLILVYGGLTYLGATVSTMYDASVSQTELLVNITRHLLGGTGTVILGVVVAFACLTTSIGLTSVTAKYFEDVTNKRLKYEYIVTFICIFSAVMSNLGVDKIISIAAPILSILYPVAIVLVLMSSLSNIFTKDSMFKGAAYVTLFISLLTALDNFGIEIRFIHYLPFSKLGLNWIVPAMIGALIGNIIFKDNKAIFNKKAS